MDQASVSARALRSMAPKSKHRGAGKGKQHPSEKPAMDRQDVDASATAPLPARLSLKEAILEFARPVDNATADVIRRNPPSRIRDQDGFLKYRDAFKGSISASNDLYRVWLEREIDALIMKALAPGLLASLKLGRAVAEGNIDGGAPEKIPFAIWSGEWLFDAEQHSAHHVTTPTKIEGLTISRPEDVERAAPASNPRNAGRPPLFDWPTLNRKFLWRAVANKSMPTKTLAIAWFREFASDPRGGPQERAIREQFRAIYGREGWDQLGGGDSSDKPD